MASDVRKDTTDVYRYKITKTGLRRKHWDDPELIPYEDISFRGYYMSKQSWNPWRNRDETVKLELQKLALVLNKNRCHSGDTDYVLGWVTIRTKTYGGEEEEE